MTSLPLEYGPLLGELLGRAAARRQPVNGIFELTSRCNLSCRMCYVQHDAGDSLFQEKELSASAWLALARQAVEGGMVFLLLTGGEVFLRPDFFEIYEPLTRMGLMLTLFTNGTLITNAVAEKLAKAPPSRTEITLYGATASTYEAITRVPGSYKRCCAGIEALVSRGIPLGLKTTITRQNVSELEAMRQMAHNWGLQLIPSWLLSKRPDGAPSEVESCRLSASASVALEATDRAAADAWTETERRGSTGGSDKNFYCDAGRNVFAVNPSGEMNICLDLPLPGARPLGIGFRAAWEQVQQHVDSALEAASNCIQCGVIDYCPRCPGWSYLETGTLTEPVEYLCQIARARKERYEKPV